MSAQAVDVQAVLEFAGADINAVPGSLPHSLALLALLARQHAERQAAVTEYIAARDAYEAATKPATGFAMPPIVSHGDPRLLRYRKAREALRLEFLGAGDNGNG